MAKAIVSYNFKCVQFDGQKHKEAHWELDQIKILDRIVPPYENLDEGWYVDKDKEIAYFYTKDFEDRDELKQYTNNLQPISYKLNCYVKYDYMIKEFNDISECEKAMMEGLPKDDDGYMWSECLCKEGHIEDCVDVKNKFLIAKLNTCVKSNGNRFSLLKILKGPNSA